MLLKDLSGVKKSPLKGARPGGFSSSANDSLIFAITVVYLATPSKIAQNLLTRAVCLRLVCSMGPSFVVILLGGFKKNQGNTVGVKIGAAERVAPRIGRCSKMLRPKYLGTKRGAL